MRKEGRTEDHPDFLPSFPPPLSYPVERRPRSQAGQSRPRGGYRRTEGRQGGSTEGRKVGRKAGRRDAAVAIRHSGPEQASLVLRAQAVLPAAQQLLRPRREAPSLSGRTEPPAGGDRRTEGRQGPPPDPLHSNHNHATIMAILGRSPEVPAQSRQQSHQQSRPGRWGAGTWPHSLHSNHNHATITSILLWSLEAPAQSRQQSHQQSRSGRRGAGAVIVPTTVLEKCSLEVL